MFYLIKRTAQWVNKPKFHGLLHLPEFCRRFGTASSFATEKFEGYNGVLRNSSIHSNRQSPGKDIGVTFANYRNLRHLFSGGYFWDPKHKVYQTAAPSVSALFSNSPSMQKSMGYNTKSLANSSEVNAVIRDRRVPASSKLTVPAGLKNLLPCFTWSQVAEIGLTHKDVVRVKSWILVSRI
jgi:hypothetical protein